jgi:hypothetical protein
MKAAALLIAAAALATGAVAAPRVDLSGFAQPSGAITVLDQGAAVDPYFALQALLLARDNGLDAQAEALRFAQWLLPRQKPDGTFDRFCRGDAGDWVACKSADADDSLLALWVRLISTLPAEVRMQPAFRRSADASQAALDHLFQPSRGIYMVSPLTLHGLFMDNLEVWSVAGATAPRNDARRQELARAIHATFWDAAARRFIVSTQLEQRGQPAAFYPDAIAQVFPLLVDYPLLPTGASRYYRDWMKQHRKAWLAHGEADYPWGLIAVLAVRQGDTASARCWLRQAQPLRRSNRWAVTDEVSYQVLQRRDLRPAAAGTSCE